jgi:hypothetical protein
MNLVIGLGLSLAVANILIPLDRIWPYIVHDPRNFLQSNADRQQTKSVVRLTPRRVSSRRHNGVQLLCSSTPHS